MQDNSLTSGFFDKKDEEEEDWSMLDNDAQASYDAAAANAAQAKENTKNAEATPDNESNSQEKTVEETAAWIDAYTVNQANMAALREEDRKARAAQAAAAAAEEEKRRAGKMKEIEDAIKGIAELLGDMGLSSINNFSPMFMTPGWKEKDEKENLNLDDIKV